MAQNRKKRQTLRMKRMKRKQRRLTRRVRKQRGGGEPNAANYPGSGVVGRMPRGDGEHFEPDDIAVSRSV
jgi:hypothetical protein